ncbi:MAG TPA: TrkH family potassium uptake protein [Hydrogenispora sp.]|nr:TrkH family potassium uptake protein [Hydrogenispora sp.]
MRLRLVLNRVGKILILLAIIMVVPLGVALFYQGTDILAFTYSIVVTLLAGGLLTLIKPEGDLRRREGLAVVGLGWLLVTAFGALPFLWSGTTQTYTDAFFETMSGFTTTGATILANVEGTARGILFWRSLTHWLGGMGIIVLSLALFPAFRQGVFLYEAEVPSPFPDKVVPRLRTTSVVLWLIYSGFTLLETIILRCAGMSWYEGTIHAMGTLATGGYSTRNISVEAFHSLPIELILIVFMFLAGLNFSFYYRILKKRSLKPLWQSTEVRVFCGVILVASILVTIALAGSYGLPLGEAYCRALFQVVSVITTTGFSNDNFDQWPDLARAVLLVLMFFGGCTGSTAGAIKIGRLVVLFRYFRRQVTKAYNPRQVIPTKLDGVALPATAIHSMAAFFFIYLTLFAFGILWVAATGADLITAVSAAASCIGNVGPGLGAVVGPLGNYGGLHPLAKWGLSLLMLAGRLEILPLLVLFSPRFWHR